MKLYINFFAAVILCSCSLADHPASQNDGYIKPWETDPSYWQYKGEPVLLLGATDNNNLFRLYDLESHLDSLVSIGGNYIRFGLSGHDKQHAYALTGNGKYDLTKWNDNYWKAFENLLELAIDRDIIVQVEVWDRFDYSRDNWLSNPYNPGNNINFTYQEAGLDSIYPAHPSSNLQPFFFTVPELDNNEVLLKFQNAFVKKVLSLFLRYDNVLYCIDNETLGTEEWATYWAGFIKDNSAGKDIYITQMWDPWDVKSDIHKRTIDHPERYGFIDISQNSQTPGRPNWDNAGYVFKRIRENPRPVNSTKIYGADIYEPWQHRGMTTSHAIQTFCRNMLGGFAASRFHRPPHGLGLSGPAINTIKTIRSIEEHVKMWEITPRMDLLAGAEGNQAYIAAKEGEKYVIYFTGGEKAMLDLRQHPGDFSLRWIATEDAKWGPVETIKGGGFAELSPAGALSCFAVVIKK
jgi:hypothetical protein